MRTLMPSKPIVIKTRLTIYPLLIQRSWKNVTKQGHDRKNLGISKTVTNQATTLQFALMCEPCGFVTGQCNTFNNHLHLFPHFIKFSKNNVFFYQTFCQFHDNAHNFKRHTDSKKHERKL